MPIRPENKSRYPKDWPQIRQRILDRALNRCEWCGVEDHAIGYRNAAGEFRELDMGSADAASMDGDRVIKIVLTIAHVNDPSPENCSDENLAALCQRCHLNHDRPHHNMMRVQNQIDKEVAGGQSLLFVPAIDGTDLLGSPAPVRNATIPARGRQLSGSTVAPASSGLTGRAIDTPVSQTSQCPTEASR